MAAKRLLFEVHRWVGIALALFMAMWFISGLVIVYSGSTNQTRGQQLAHAETLAPESGWLSLGEAWTSSADERKAANRGKRTEQVAPQTARGEAKSEGGKKADVISDARLIRKAGVPIWLVEDGRGQRFAISALDGKLFKIDVERAQRIANEWVKSAPIDYLDTVDFTLSSRNQQALGPFHRFSLGDFSGTQLLISSKTGDVLQENTRLERGMYAVGNWLHVFRPLDYIGLEKERHTVIAWVSFFAVIAIIAGLIIGWLRWRPSFFGKHTYSEGRTQPYRAFWFRWHFWAGLIGGTFTLFWALSGYLNNNPWDIFSPANASREEIAKYQGEDFPALALSWKPSPNQGEATETVELGWKRLGKEAVLLAYTRDGLRHPQTVEGALTQFDEAALLNAATRLQSETGVSQRVLQSEYDSYYYPSKRQGSIEKPLPVWRVEFEDAVGTRLYIDPQDGRLVLKQDQSRRVFRWVFSALHHWDFGWLAHRPLWDGWIVTWILFGIVLSISSIVLAWKRLRHTFRAKQQQENKASEPVDLETANQSA
jgi:uncharacterized iron-regulated membrane protein